MSDVRSSVNGSIWTGGTIEYSEMHEASPYWLYVISVFSFLKKLNKSYKKIQRLITTIFNSDTKLANQTTEKMILFLTQMKANIINEQKKIIKLNKIFFNQNSNEGCFS